MPHSYIEVHPLLDSSSRAERHWANQPPLPQVAFRVFTAGQSAQVAKIFALLRTALLQVRI